MSNSDAMEIQRAEVAQQQTEGGQQPQIDLHLLAEKVYRLMLADLRLEQARSGSPQKRRGRP
jgi:predicted ATPase